MISTISQKKKGVVLVELIAYTTIMALVSVSVFSLLFFVFKAYDVTTQTTRNNQTTMDIVYSVQDEINKWSPTSLDIDKSKNNKVIFQRYYIITVENGKTDKIKFETPQTLTIEFTDNNIQMTDENGIKRLLLPEYLKINKQESNISVKTYLDYSIINFKVITDSSRPLTVTMSIPVNAK